MEHFLPGAFHGDTSAAFLVCKEIYYNLQLLISHLRKYVVYRMSLLLPQENNNFSTISRSRFDSRYCKSKCFFYIYIYFALKMSEYVHVHDFSQKAQR